MLGNGGGTVGLTNAKLSHDQSPQHARAQSDTVAVCGIGVHKYDELEVGSRCLEPGSSAWCWFQQEPGRQSSAGSLMEDFLRVDY